MPAYAILGATGFTGRCILGQLSSEKDITLNLYARSKAKLLEQNPSLETPGPDVNLFIGPLSDQALITSCIRGVDAVFCVLATNDSKPGCCIAQDAMRAVLGALKELKATTQSPRTLPKLIILSAAPASAVFKKGIPAPVNWMLWRTLGSLYRDLELAEAMVREEKSWVRATFVYPAGLSNVGDGRVFGHKLSTEKAGEGFMSYGDLAAGMVEIAKEESGKWDWVDVTIVQAGAGGKMDWGRFARMLLGGVVFGGN